MRKKGKGSRKGVLSAAAVELEESTRYVLPRWNEDATFQTLELAQRFADEHGHDWVVELESLGPFPVGPTGRQWFKDEDGWCEVPEGWCMCDACILERMTEPVDGQVH
jgi:hypothetical protein